MHKGICLQGYEIVGYNSSDSDAPEEALKHFIMLSGELLERDADEEAATFSITFKSAISNCWLAF